MTERPEGDWELRPAADLDLSLGERLRSPSRERGLLDTVLGSVWWGCVGLYLRVYHRLRIEGAEHLPQRAPFVLIANHSSHLDAMTLGAALRRRLRHCTYPIAAGDTFFESPATASFAAFLLNALPLWRKNAGRHALAQLRTRLVGEPCGYILFPEGTRSRSGELGHFKPGLGMMVAGTEVAVVPCLLLGAHAAMPPDKQLPRPRRIELRIGAPLCFAELENDKAGWQAVAAQCEVAVRALATH